MPRGQKSKIRAREKRRQAREEPMNVMGLQATVAKEESSASSPHSINNPERSSAARATTSQEPESASSTMAAAAASCTSFDEDTCNQVGEMLSNLELTTKECQKDFVEERVAILVHYLLYKYQMKEPFTKVEILKNVIQVTKNHFSDDLKKASNHLELTFGLDLKKLDTSKNTYVLINKLELDRDVKVNDNEYVPTTGLLMNILGVIFTKGNCAIEEQVWEVLSMMGIFDGHQHHFFGDTRKLITKDLVKEKYLEYRQVPNSNPPRYEFLWGPRACAETSKMKVLEFLAKIYNCAPSSFSPWYEEALKDEEERAKARVAARSHSAAVARSRSKVNPSSFPSPR
ncbi:melanoma-associated antigen B10 [Heterocephalus glaber]|uniref:Melanoma-associated antigen B10 n=1 Tax=Heterocephalus glaber TaxID=10181 RepID=A0AAX6PS69_HETGA|nr:melanoma-associated antigen B10 [Heterocephalus glaber]